MAGVPRARIYQTAASCSTLGAARVAVKAASGEARITPCALLLHILRDHRQRRAPRMRSRIEIMQYDGDQNAGLR
jgi:hypothetical protein